MKDKIVFIIPIRIGIRKSYSEIVKQTIEKVYQDILQFGFTKRPAFHIGRVEPRMSLFSRLGEKAKFVINPKGRIKLQDGRTSPVLRSGIMALPAVIFSVKAWQLVGLEPTHTSISPVLRSDIMALPAVSSFTLQR